MDLEGTPRLVVFSGGWFRAKKKTAFPFPAGSTETAPGTPCAHPPDSARPSSSTSALAEGSGSQSKDSRQLSSPELLSAVAPAFLPEFLRCPVASG